MANDKVFFSLIFENSDGLCVHQTPRFSSKRLSLSKFQQTVFLSIFLYYYRGVNSWKISILNESVHSKNAKLGYTKWSAMLLIINYFNDFLRAS